MKTLWLLLALAAFFTALGVAIYAHLHAMRIQFTPDEELNEWLTFK